MSCGHDGCTCGPDQPASDTQLPTADHTASPHAGDSGHGCTSHGGHGHGEGGCCGRHADSH